MKISKFLNSVYKIESSCMASKIALVIFKSILFPVPYLPPFQPVLTNQQLVWFYYIFWLNISAYTLGCNGKNAAPKQAENVLYGSIIPISVPATLEV